MAIYASNENGDWWEVTPDQVIYILDTDTLSDYDKNYILETWGDIPSDDKFERVIEEYGTAIVDWNK
jgi:hypothetical protein